MNELHSYEFEITKDKILNLSALAMQNVTKLFLFKHIQRQELVLLYSSPVHSNDNENLTSIRIKTNVWSTREYSHFHLDPQNFSKALSQG
jgi:hypothetical protein